MYASAPPPQACAPPASKRRGPQHKGDPCSAFCSSPPSPSRAAPTATTPSTRPSREGGGTLHPDGRCLYLLTSAKIDQNGHTLDFEISRGGSGWEGSLSVDGETWELRQDGEPEWFEIYGHALVRLSAGEDRELRVYARSDTSSTRMSLHEAGVDEVGTPEHRGSITPSRVWSMAGTWSFWSDGERDIVAGSSTEVWEDDQPCL